MERRRAFITALAVGAVAFTGSIATATNVGLLGFRPSSNRVGALTSADVALLLSADVGVASDPTSSDATGATPSTIVRYIDVYVTSTTKLAGRPIASPTKPTNQQRKEADHDGDQDDD